MLGCLNSLFLDQLSSKIWSIDHKPTTSFDRALVCVSRHTTSVQTFNSFTIDDNEYSIEENKTEAVNDGHIIDFPTYESQESDKTIV